MRVVVILGAATVLVGGCFMKTQYKSADFRGGYNDVEVQPNLYLVSFTGNGYTRRDEVIAGWHRRAAELCGGRSRYQIVEHNTQTTATQEPAQVNTTATSSGNTTQIHSTVSPGITVYKSRAEGYVRCEPPSPAEEEPEPTDYCDSGDADACMVLARQHYDAGNHRESLVYASKACKAGYAAACAHAAAALESGQGIEADPAKAAVLWKQACKLGDDKSCEEFARLRTAGPAVTNDEAACDRGNAEACIRAISSSIEADDLAGAISVAVSACAAGAAPVCMLAAEMQLSIDSPEQAAESYKAACKLGHDDACNAFADLRATTPARLPADAAELGNGPTSEPSF